MCLHEMFSRSCSVGGNGQLERVNIYNNNIRCVGTFRRCRKKHLKFLPVDYNNSELSSLNNNLNIIYTYSY